MRLQGPAWWVVGLALLLSAAGAVGQGTFQNLGFESANLSPVPAGQYGGSVFSLDAIPGWTGFLGTNQVTQVLQNDETLGDASIDILGPYWNLGGIIEGQYTVVLEPGLGPGDVNASASITQVGLVPANAQSLLFKAATFSPFSVSLAGQTLSLVSLGTGPNYTLYGADISSLAGQTGALTITALAAYNTSDYFDSFQFSNLPIPEPGVFSLSVLGVLVLGGRVLGRRR
jgi:hypothetical protein